MFADVLLPLPLVGAFTYGIPAEMTSSLKVGMRVLVPFGKKKVYTGIVTDIREPFDKNDTTRQPDFVVKELLEQLDTSPILLPEQYRLWQWIAAYYLCSEGEVMKAALPSGLKLESESLVTLQEEEAWEDAELTPGEQNIVEILRTCKSLSIAKIQASTTLKSVVPVLKHLLELGVVMMQEEVRRKFVPKTEMHVRLTSPHFTVAAIEEILRQLNTKRTQNQYHLLETYLLLSSATAAARLENEHLLQEVSKKTLLEKTEVSDAVLKRLTQKGILEIYPYEIARRRQEDAACLPLHSLNEAQQTAYDSIKQVFTQKDICLLHGVTSSGKTEIYIHLIDEMMKQGKQVLYLLPEIALTTQITERLTKVFGNKLGVYHSKFPDAERVEMWQKMLSDSPYRVVLGVRSSIFLPYKDLGLIIVDEEHEATYKQQEPAPRYKAGDVALILASYFKGKVLLGSATPSIDSYYHAMQGNFGLVELTQRYQNIELPSIEVVDIGDLQHRRMMRGAFSPTLLDEMQQALERKEQVILFQNRRGFAPVVECHTCGWVPRCKQCDVSLTYHKERNVLVCHYCGYTEVLPQKCPACEETDLRHKGYGTEKIEEEVQTLFPGVATARLDLDTTKSRTAYERILADFTARKTSILIGTQMVTKGLDFDHVHVVGILNADTIMNYPDFRSYERAYQMMVQVAGRAGRKGEQGKVILQTKMPDNPLIDQIVTGDYKAFYRAQVQERELFHYPPYYRLVYIYIKHKDVRTVDLAAQRLAQLLRQAFGERVLGPDIPAVSRIQTLFIRKMILKIEPGASRPKIKEWLRYTMSLLMQDKQFTSLVCYYDVDPQ
jgi:primosomal protein N' (replication factor Y)